MQEQWLLGPSPTGEEKLAVVRSVMAALDPRIVLRTESSDRLCFGWNDPSAASRLMDHTIDIQLHPPNNRNVEYSVYPVHGSLFALLPEFFAALFRPPTARSLDTLVAFYELIPEYLRWALKFATFEEHVNCLQMVALTGRLCRNVAEKNGCPSLIRPREGEGEDADAPAKKRSKTDAST
jgi:hypothetical protein